MGHVSASSSSFSGVESPPGNGDNKETKPLEKDQLIFVGRGDILVSRRLNISLQKTQYISMFSVEFCVQVVVRLFLCFCLLQCWSFPHYQHQKKNGDSAGKLGQKSTCRFDATLDTLSKTNSSSLKMGHPKRKQSSSNHPTIHFQVRLLLVSGRVVGPFLQLSNEFKQDKFQKIVLLSTQQVNI